MLNLKKIKNIDHSFFEIDENTRIARVILEYEKAEEIFNPCIASLLPVINEDFLTTISTFFSIISRKYKIDLTIRIDDMGGYTEDELSEILRKNFILETKNKIHNNGGRIHACLGLVGIGILCVAAMLIIEHYWETDSLWRTIFFYIFDITATVMIWEALSVLYVEFKEKRLIRRNIRKRLLDIHFEKSTKAPSI